MKDETRVYKKNSDIVQREIEKDLILMPIYRTNRDTNEMYTLNGTAKAMWDLIDGKRSKREVLDALCAKFDASPKKIEEELDEFLKDLREIKAIE